MDGTVVSIAFNGEELKQLRNLMALEGEKHLSTLLRKRLGFKTRFQHGDWIVWDEFEDLNSVHKMAKQITYLATTINRQTDFFLQMVGNINKVLPTGFEVNTKEEARKIAAEQEARKLARKASIIAYQQTLGQHKAAFQEMLSGEQYQGEGEMEPVDD